MRHCFVFSTGPSVSPSVRSSVTKLVNAIFWKRMNRFRCRSEQMIRGARAWNSELCFGGQGLKVKVTWRQKESQKLISVRKELTKSDVRTDGRTDEYRATAWAAFMHSIAQQKSSDSSCDILPTPFGKMVRYRRSYPTISVARCYA